MSFRRCLVTCLLAGAVFAGRQAVAQTASEPPLGDVSRSGPVVRLRAGPTYLSTTIGYGESADRSYAGPGFTFDAEIGGWRSSHVSICLALSGAVALAASARDPGTISNGGASADLSTAAIGPSIGYTFGASEVYLGATPSLSFVRVSSPDHFFLAKYWGSNYGGVGIAFLVSKEWRISEGWQIGLAGEARYAAVSGVGDVSTMSAYSLLFSAAFD